MKILLKIFSFLLVAGVMAGCSKNDDENGGGSNWKPNLGDYDPVPLSDFADDFYKWCLNKFDTNRDGVLQYVEIKEIEDLTFNYNGATNVLRSLEGIKYFTSLKYLTDRMGITMETLDLSHNEFLEKIDFLGSGSRLKYLNIGKKNNLNFLSIGGPSLTSLDVTKCPKLTSLHLNDGAFATLDLSKNVNLTELTLSGESLTILDLSKNVNLTELRLSGESLTTLDLSTNVSLTRLYCDGAQLTTLDLSKNAGLTVVNCRDMPNLTSVDLSNNKFQYKSFDFSECSNLEVIYVWKGWTKPIHWHYPDNVQILEK